MAELFYESSWVSAGWFVQTSLNTPARYTGKADEVPQRDALAPGGCENKRPRLTRPQFDDQRSLMLLRIDHDPARQRCLQPCQRRLRPMLGSQLAQCSASTICLLLTSRTATASPAFTMKKGYSLLGHSPNSLVRDQLAPARVEPNHAIHNVIET